MIPDQKTEQDESSVEQPRGQVVSREQRAKERPSTARPWSQNDSSRRRFLQGALGGTFVTIAAAAASLEFAATPAAERRVNSLQMPPCKSCSTETTALCPEN
jgi:hypothetical protein